MNKLGKYALINGWKEWLGGRRRLDTHGQFELEIGNSFPPLDTLEAALKARQQYPCPNIIGIVRRLDGSTVRNPEEA